MFLVQTTQKRRRRGVCVWDLVVPGLPALNASSAWPTSWLCVGRIKLVDLTGQCGRLFVLWAASVVRGIPGPAAVRSPTSPAAAAPIILPRIRSRRPRRHHGRAACSSQASDANTLSEPPATSLTAAHVRRTIWRRFVVRAPQPVVRLAHPPTRNPIAAHHPRRSRVHLHLVIPPIRPVRLPSLPRRPPLRPSTSRATLDPPDVASYVPSCDQQLSTST